VGDFKKEENTGSSQTVKDAASQGEQVIAHHLEMIKQIAQAHNLSTVSASK